MVEPTENQLKNFRPRLLRADASTVDYWLRDWLREATNALHAHMQVYESNPGGWDQHSSHAALQRIVDDLTIYTISLVGPVPAISMTGRHVVLRKMLAEYLVLSRANVLVREGYGCGDTAKYAKLFTGVLKTFVAILNDPDPGAVYKNWRAKQAL